MKDGMKAEIILAAIPGNRDRGPEAGDVDEIYES